MCKRANFGLFSILFFSAYSMYTADAFLCLVVCINGVLCGSAYLWHVSLLGLFYLLMQSNCKNIRAFDKLKNDVTRLAAISTDDSHLLHLHRCSFPHSLLKLIPGRHGLHCCRLTLNVLVWILERDKHIN